MNSPDKRARKIQRVITINGNWIRIAANHFGASVSFWLIYGVKEDTNL